MPDVQLHSVAIHVHDEGTGPVVVLLHGFPLDHTMWRQQISALSASYRVIAPDLRGFGSSTIEPIAAKTGISMDQYAEDVGQVLDQLGVAEPVVLVGFSMGGYVAFRLLATQGERIRALVLCDTRAVADTPQGREGRYNMAENVEGWGSGHVASLMLPKLVASSTQENHPEVVAEVEAIIGRTNPVAIAAAQRGMAHREDSTPLVGKIAIPTLCLVGADDAITSPDDMHSLAEAIPDGEFVEVPDAGHLSPMENPQVINDVLMRFLAKLN